MKCTIGNLFWFMMYYKKKGRKRHRNMLKVFWIVFHSCYPKYSLCLRKNNFIFLDQSVDSKLTVTWLLWTKSKFSITLVSHLVLYGICRVTLNLEILKAIAEKMNTKKWSAYIYLKISFGGKKNIRSQYFPKLCCRQEEPNTRVLLHVTRIT